MTATTGAATRSQVELVETHPYLHLLARGLLAAIAAMTAVMVVAALMKALGVEFEIPRGGEDIPVAGFGTVTGVFSVVGLAIAAALRRWSAHPARRFLQTAATLTALSFVPPVVSGAAAVTVVCLVALHIVAACVVISALVRALSRSSA